MQGIGGIAPLILSLDIGWRWVVSFTHWPLYFGERLPGTHWIGGWVGLTAGLEAFGGKQICCLYPKSKRLLWLLHFSRMDIQWCISQTKKNFIIFIIVL